MAVRWDQAQRRAVKHWQRILDGIGRRDALAVVSEINELSALCEMAREDAGGEAGRCAHCVVFADANQCVDTRLDISALVLDGRLDEARAASATVVRRITAASPSELF